MPNDATVNPAAPNIPFNREAERTLIGALLMDSEKIHEVVSIVQPADFHDPVNVIVYQAMCDLHRENKVVDFAIVGDRLKDNEHLIRLGGSAFLAQVAQSIPTAAHALQYADIVKEYSQRRSLLKTASELQVWSTDQGNTPLEVMEKLEQNLTTIHTDATTAQIASMSDLLSQRHDHYCKALEEYDEDYWLRTGFKNLDSMIDLNPTHLQVLAARPGSGKSSLMMNIAYNVALKQKKSVLVFSLEMSKEQLFDRMAGAELGVPSRDLNRGNFDEGKLDTFAQMADRLSEMPLYIDDTANSVAQMVRRARKLKRQHGLDLIAIDYLQIIKPSRISEQKPRVYQIQDMTAEIKRLARELEVPIILLSQLSRKPAERKDARPIMSDLRDSGAIEQDADSIVMLYRDEDEDTPSKLTELLVRKNREGETGTLYFNFDAPRVKFSPAVPSDAQLPANEEAG